MDVTALAISDVKLVRPRRFPDARGVFSELYNREALSAAGLPNEYVQDNCSVSHMPGTVRGLHYQLPPFDQAKLVIVLKGRVHDVVVDLRKGSPTYRSHVSVELSGEEWQQLFVPAGFAHGFCTLEPDTMVLYKVSAPYAPKLDAGIIWDDPDLAIAWPVASEQAMLSDKDKALPRLRDLVSPFNYAGAS